MKIKINQITPKGLTLEEEMPVSLLDLETDIVKLRGPVKIKAQVSQITNTITVDLTLNSTMDVICSRCLNEFEIDLQKNLRLSYPVTKQESTIDLGAQIREEIILDYPFKPLCRPDCKGLCPKCGKNLNEGQCSC